MRSSNMKNDKPMTSHKKVTSKRRGKIQAFFAFTHTRFYSVLSNFFWCNFFAVFLTSLALKFSMHKYSFL